VCTILLAWRCVAGAPVLLAANRDELIARLSDPPGVLVEQPLTAGGRDRVAGGTWLAVTADARIAAVTNRHQGERDPSRRSRGELPLLLLGSADDAAAHALVAGLDAGAYNPFNVLHVSSAMAVVGHGRADGHVDVVDLAPGAHVLTVHDVDDTDQVKVAALRGMLDSALAGASDAGAALLAMEEVLRDHGGEGRSGVDAACVHGDVYGTVSSSSLRIDDDGGIVYRHAQGRPCVTPHVDVSPLLSRRSEMSRRAPG
jgi:uncharacterized protein with NRDE domain